MSDSLQPHGLQHARPPCPSPTPGVYPNSCPLSRWCHLTISSSVVPFSACPQSFPIIRVFSNESCLSSSYSRGKWGTDTTALSFIRGFIKVKSLQLKESVREHKAHEASSDLIVNHWLRFFVGITASFQIQIIVRILLWPLRRKHRSARTTYIQPTPDHSLPRVKNHHSKEVHGSFWSDPAGPEQQGQHSFSQLSPRHWESLDYKRSGAYRNRERERESEWVCV